MNTLESLAQQITTTFLSTVQDKSTLTGLCIYHASPLELVRFQRALTGVFLRKGMSYEYRIHVSFLDSDVHIPELVYIDLGVVLDSIRHGHCV